MRFSALLGALLVLLFLQSLVLGTGRGQLIFELVFALVLITGVAGARNRRHVHVAFALAVLAFMGRLTTLAAELIPTVIGQFFIAVFVARLVGMHITAR